MDTILDIYFQRNRSYEVRRETSEGVNYLVVPVVMMVEGVHSGSHGPILHTAEELGRFPASWDGIPVTIGHPIVNGHYVSANSPEVLRDWAVGKIFNTYMDGDKLRAEAWVDEEKINQISPETLAMINNGEIIEVSIGVFSDEDEQEGIYNNERYTAIARNHRPNHLALLPAEVGACSIQDGCGVRVNKKGGPKVDLIVNESNENQILKELALKGLVVNQTGMYELANKAQSALNNMDSDNSSYYLEEIFPDHLIFKVYSYEDRNRSVKYFKQAYSENTEGVVILNGDPIQVKRVVDYPQVNVDSTIINNKKEVQTMSEKCTPCVKAAVDALIANKATSYSETDRDWLEGLTEAQLEKMTPVTVEKTVQANVTREQVLEVLTNNPLSTEEYLKTVSPETREQLSVGLQLHTQRKAKMVETIVANNSGVWTKEELEAMDFTMLTKLSSMVAVNQAPVNQGVQDYTLLGGGNLQTHTAPTVEPMAPFGVEFETEK
jgi:hypothetical protein